ncbi:hypothetical protein KSP35_16005 [Aquihabitans sp. G128]|uniref:hypothetical protein n=1 Tax=Aquihabitans sp. G128 TaxID=2849779 RepID=UPI001C245B40|nr:hypothetical protein [Aquihabitans sp. G128]QXC59871.1 hypothetical protein KSP35_16005 [Aquihabitans sp. G128]
MATSAPTPRRNDAARGEFSRRTLVLSALALALVLIGGVAVVALTTDDGTATDRTTQVSDEAAKPESIPQPGSGTAPKNAADRGGSEQLALFGVMLGGMVLIGVVIFRGGKRAKAGRQLWFDAAATGRDGAVDGHGDLVASAAEPRSSWGPGEAPAASANPPSTDPA